MKQVENGGFTLIEAAVAIAVVAILSGIIVPLVVKNIQDSQLARAKNDVQIIAAAIASQMKDTGCRPSAAGGPGTSTGATAGAIWGSGPSGATSPTNGTMTANNTFTNLFTNAKGTATADTLFGTTANTEFCYKGPYMAQDTAEKVDPWGRRYLLLGYNTTGQAANGPIWVVSAGPDQSLLAANVSAGANPPSTWDASGVGADDIYARVN